MAFLRRNETTEATKTVPSNSSLGVRTNSMNPLASEGDHMTTHDSSPFRKEVVDGEQVLEAEGIVGVRHTHSLYCDLYPIATSTLEPSIGSGVQ